MTNTALLVIDMQKEMEFRAPARVASAPIRTQRRTLPSFWPCSAGAGCRSFMFITTSRERPLPLVSREAR
jgi:hypothetical protein